MRALLILLVSLSLFPAGQAAEATRGKVIKVLPVFLDLEGRDAKSPSLFDRDAYQAYLRAHTIEISGQRFNVQWKAKKGGSEKISLIAELRGVDAKGLPKVEVFEKEVKPGTFSKWTEFPLVGEDYKKFGAVVAWRVSLWEGDQLIGEQKSFFW